MDRIVLTVNGSVVYDNGSQFTTPLPPVPIEHPPVQPTPTPPPVGIAGYLDPPGSLPVLIPSKSCRFIARNVTTTQLSVEIGNTFHPYTVTVRKPDGSVASKWRRYFMGIPMGQEAPAVMRGPEASLLVDTHTPGDYMVDVVIEDTPDQPQEWSPGLSRINHWRNDL